MAQLPIVKAVTSLLLRTINPAAKLASIKCFDCPNARVSINCYSTASKSCRPASNHQEIIEDTYEKDKIQSRAIIEKVNNHIASGNAGRLFAVIHAQGKQYRVATEDILIIARNWPPQQFDNIIFEKVMLVGGASFTLIGKPILPINLVRVRGTVVHKDLTHTKIRYHHIPKERVHNLNFVREDLTWIRITDIELYPKINSSEDTHYLRT